MAHAADPQKLILVLYKDIPLLEGEIPPLIRYLLDAKTYSEWVENADAETLFWRKLILTCSSTLNCKEVHAQATQLTFMWTITEK